MNQEQKRLAKLAAWRASQGKRQSAAAFKRQQKQIEQDNQSAFERKDTRIADRIDGFDRDDIGLSPDY